MNNAIKIINRQEKMTRLQYFLKRNCSALARNATRILLREGIENGKFLWCYFNDVLLAKLRNFKRLMLRLHMQVWQPDTERKTCKKVLSCCQARAIFCLWRGKKACFILQARNLNFKIWKAVFTNVRFRSWSSKPLSVNAAWDTKNIKTIQYFNFFLKFDLSKG